MFGEMALGIYPLARKLNVSFAVIVVVVFPKNLLSFCLEIALAK
jgi:hypothetical protein